MGHMADAAAAPPLQSTLAVQWHRLRGTFGESPLLIIPGKVLGARVPATFEV